MKSLELAIGWAIVHSLWQGAMIAAALAVVLTVVRSSRRRYQAACVSLLLLLGGFLGTMWQQISESKETLLVSPALVTPIWRTVGGGLTEHVALPGMDMLIAWLTPIWVTGVCVFCAGHWAGWSELARLRRKGVCSAPLWLVALTEKLAAGMKISRRVELVESCLTQMPVVIGHFRPLILLPLGFAANLTTDQAEAILLHELAHIHRFDYLVNNLQRVVESLLFYHPAAWWMSRVIRNEREHCCDDEVVAMRGDAYGYAVALTCLEESRGAGRGMALAASGGNLVNRIQHLLYPRRSSSVWASVLPIALFLITAAAGVAGWHSQPTPESSFNKWLNEDVVYLITPEERTAFLKLTTDDERQKFVEQFWLRRDPPGAAANTFKNEHYRRIAYANKHWAMDKPGWQTDRGHVYILYGPPDEIDSHPHRFEDWLYYHVNGLGDHVQFHYLDPGNGDFRLAPGQPVKGN